MAKKKVYIILSILMTMEGDMDDRMNITPMVREIKYGNKVLIKEKKNVMVNRLNVMNALEFI